MKPKAWRGSVGFASVCAWCPDKAAADALAESLGLTISHGICDDCRAALGFPAPALHEPTLNGSAARILPGLLAERPRDPDNSALPLLPTGGGEAPAAGRSPGFQHDNGCGLETLARGGEGAEKVRAG